MDHWVLRPGRRERAGMKAIVVVERDWKMGRRFVATVREIRRHITDLNAGGGQWRSPLVCVLPGRCKSTDAIFDWIFSRNVQPMNIRHLVTMGWTNRTQVRVDHRACAVGPTGRQASSRQRSQRTSQYSACPVHLKYATSRSRSASSVRSTSTHVGHIPIFTPPSFVTI